MSVRVLNCGAVSPAGHGVASLEQAVSAGAPIAAKQLARAGADALRVRAVPALAKKPEFITHARLRRTSPISQYVVAAALEAIGSDLALVQQNKLRLGLVLSVTCGCVNYSRRFYHEAWNDPATASPLLFPETVFNAPVSHLAALLGTTEITYTLVGEPVSFAVGLAVAANWLHANRVDRCLVIGAEESDWLTAEAARLFDKDIVMSEGAGALYLGMNDAQSSDPAQPTLNCVTTPSRFQGVRDRTEAARKVRCDLTADSCDALLVDGLQNAARTDAAEETAWQGWTGRRISPKRVLGEGLSAATAWQCICAIRALRHNGTGQAIVSVVGAQKQAIGARFSLE